MILSLNLKQILALLRFGNLLFHKLDNCLCHVDAFAGTESFELISEVQRYTTDV